jgi:hypothetical protein
VDLRPPYSAAEIASVSRDMHARMLEMMKVQHDPFPESQMPPMPLE